MTKTSGLAPSARTCSASVQYNDRSGPCKHEAKYPDPDGVRWWCGIHNPDRNKPRPRLPPVSVEGSEAVVDREVLLGMKDKNDEREEMLAVLHEARMALMELSTMRDSGWPPNTPIEKYKIMMTHMADRAKEAVFKLNEQIARFRS